VKLSKLGALCAVTAMAVTGLVMPLAQSASAVLPSVVCSKLTSTTTISGSNGTTSSSWSTCTPAALAAGASSKVTVPVSKLAGTITEKITWKNSKGTTTVTLTYKPQSTKGACPAGTQYRTQITGKTGASTGAAAKTVKAGEPISGMVCTKSVSGKFVSALYPGTKFKF
jgi:hypothetical protein